MITLRMRRTRFYSQGDEDAMFTWLEAISGVKSVRGVGCTLEVKVIGRPSRKALRELLAVFTRYHADLKQFKQFGGALESFLQAYTGWRQSIYGKESQRAAGNQEELR